MNTFVKRTLSLLFVIAISSLALAQTGEECFEKAKEYYSNNNFVEAAKWFRKAADQGIALAQANLGLCYEKGEGVPRDIAEAMKWYRLASESQNKK